MFTLIWCLSAEELKLQSLTGPCDVSLMLLMKTRETKETEHNSIRTLHVALLAQTGSQSSPALFPL